MDVAGEGRKNATEVGTLVISKCSDNIVYSTSLIGLGTMVMSCSAVISALRLITDVCIL